MRTPISSASVRLFAKFITAGALLFCAAPGLFADDATNTAPSPARHGLDFKFNIGSDSSSATNYYGLPKEAFDRLSPEQIMELAKSNEPPAAMIVVVPVAMFAMIIACVWLGVNQRSKRARMLHDTIRLMVEKGQPIPPELLQPHDMQRRRPSDLRYGLLFIGLGLGLAVLLFSEHAARWPVALIPLLMGVAYLVAWKIESNKNGQPK